jgi:site-specific DNA recombinase
MSTNLHTSTRKKALGYLRISDKKQIKGESKQNQRAAIEAYAKSNNIEVAKWFYDEAKSGKNADREELRNLLECALKMKGAIDYVLVYKMNRASRDIDSYIKGIKSVLATRGIQIRSVTEPFDDSPMGNFMQSLYVMVGQLDNENKRDTVIDNMTRLARQGYWQHKPIRGYQLHKIKNSEGHDKPTLQPSPEAEKITKLLMRWNRGDLTESQLVRYATHTLELLGLNGKPLTQHVVHKMIIHPVYAGYVCDKFTDFELVDGKHKGLISVDTYWQNQEVLKLKNKDYQLGLKHHKVNEMYPLRRFVRCIQCNGFLTACAPQNSPRYFCHRPGCRGTGSMMADIVHDKFEELLRTIEPKPGTVKLMKEILKRQTLKELGNINQDLADIRDKLDGIATTRTQTIKSFISGRISDEDKQAVTDDLDSEKLVLSSQLSELEQRQTISEAHIEYALNFMANIAKQWSDAPLDLKQKYQNLIFPEGFILDIKNDNFITTKISPLYSGITTVEQTDFDKNYSMVTLSHSIYKSIVEEIIRWNAITARSSTQLPSMN